MGSQIKALDNEQGNLQSLGFFGIFKESFKIIFSWPKIFIQIILAFILPQCCLYLIYNWISNLIINKIVHDTTSALVIDQQVNSPTFNNDVSSSIASEWATYCLVNVVYLVLSLILSLLTISAVVYTIACIYASKDFTFKKVVSVVPKVWKRLMITFLCKFCIMFAYFFVLTIVAIIFIVFFHKPGSQEIGAGTIITAFVITILSLVGFTYMTMIWLLADVVSVLEKNCGFKALKRSKDLVKGKMSTVFAIILVINICAMPFVALVQKLDGFGIIGRIFFGFVSVVLLGTLLTLYSLVVQTVLYFVCKSYHKESLDKSSMADHLDEYLGEYVPLNTDAV